MLLEFVVMVLAGIVLLIIEYRTGLFNPERTGTTSIRSLLPRWGEQSDLLHKLWPEVLRVIRIEFPLVVLFWGIWLIGWDSEPDNTFLVLNIVAILAFATVSESLLSEPMNHVTAWLVLFGGAAALVIKLIAPTNENLISDVVSLVLAVFLTTLGLIWISGAIIAAHAKELHRDFDFLRLTPGISKMVEAEESRLLETLRTEWLAIRTKLSTRRTQAVGTFDWFVPVKFQGYTVTLGCLEKWQLDQVNASQDNASSFGVTIEKLILEAMSNVPVRVEFKKVEAAQFLESQNLLAPKKKGDDGPSSS